jgi:magnesium transporter
VEVLTELDRGRIAALRERDEFFWLDLEAPTPEQVGELGLELGFSALAIADTRNFGQRPKLDDFGDHVLLVFWSVREAYGDPERRWRPLEHHLYISGGYVVTVRQDPWPTAAALRAEIAAMDECAESHAVYLLLRRMCDDFDTPLKELEGRVDEMEAEVFEQVADFELSELYHLRQELQDLLRREAAQKITFPSVEGAILRLPGLEVGRREEIADIRDQLVEIADDLQRHHDDIATLIQLYFSVSGDRLNRLAYRLTILATFFVIATLVTGFFGQNFGWLVGSIDSKRDFLVYGVGGLLLPTLGFAAIVWWRRRDWL